MKTFSVMLTGVITTAVYALSFLVCQQGGHQVQENEQQRAGEDHKPGQHDNSQSRRWAWGGVLRRETRWVRSLTALRNKAGSESTEQQCRKVSWRSCDGDTLSTESAEAETLSHSLNLIPYSQVTPQRTQRRRPVLFTPAALSTTIIQKILNMGGAMDFNICKPGKCWALLSLHLAFLPR